VVKIDKILFPTDFSRCSRQALAHALLLAQRFESELHLFHAVVLHGEHLDDALFEQSGPRDLVSRLTSQADQEMSGLLAVEEAGRLVVTKAQERGFHAGPVILEYAAQHGVDLIVLGTHGRRGPARLFLGSVAQEVVRTARCPVLTVREREEPRHPAGLERILVAVDFSPPAELAVAWGQELARRFGARLQLLHVVEQPIYPSLYGPIATPATLEAMAEARRGALEGLDRMAEELGVASTRHVLEGPAAAAITEFADKHDSDLVVVGTHGLTGLERLLLGSTAERVVRQAAPPVLTVRTVAEE
jgi:nucleotide-binding universal stress UspA family protein